MDLHLLPERLKVVLAVAILAGLTQVPSLQAQSNRELRLLALGDDGSYLGIEMDDVTASNMATYKLSAERGVIVRSVEKGSPAEAASLQANDVILEYAGVPVFSTAQFGRMVRETPVGRKVDLGVSRDGKKLNLSAKTGERKGTADQIGRGFTVLPDGRGLRGYSFEGPEGHVFNFQMPGRQGKALVFPALPGKPRLGVEVQQLTPQMADFLGVSGKKGVLVVSITDNSPASGKLKAGDVILLVDGQAVESPEDLTGFLAKKESGAKVDLRIVREKKEMTIPVELSKTDQPAKKKGYSL